MARRATQADAAGMGLLLAAGAVLAAVSALIALIQIAEFRFVALAIVASIGAYKGWEYYVKVYWPNKYFVSEEFFAQKKKITDYVHECNELNDHIAELRTLQEQIQTTNRGVGKLRDSSNFAYQRRGNRIAGRHVHDCSRSVVSNAQNNPFKYLCKYFDIKTDEQSLSDFESMLNDFSAAEEGATLLAQKRGGLIDSIVANIHPRIKRDHWRRLERELGFDEIVFDKLSFPTYSFQYISAGGNSSIGYDIEFDLDTLEGFIDYLSGLVKFRKSVAGQRALMTHALRESIKQRDDYHCQICRNSTYDEKNLLLEIDHIMPLSKGGITSEDNLQTLCWKCNRSKGAKVFN
jgi:hypothetical protein